MAENVEMHKIKELDSDKDDHHLANELKDHGDLESECNDPFFVLLTPDEFSFVSIFDFVLILCYCFGFANPANPIR